MPPETGDSQRRPADSRESCARTVRDVLALSTRYLAERGVATARLDAERLMAEVLKTERLELYLEPERRLAEAELAALRELVRRRGAREPAQYILGKTGFYDLELAIDRRALVPRRETELLVDRALELAHGKGVSALDLGTGCGCIALALAAGLPEGSRVVATDISPECVELARENAARAGLAEKIEFAVGDLFETTPPLRGPFDLIVANLPYIPSGEIAALMPEVRDHEPRTALDGGPDGLEIIARAARSAPQHLAAGGWLLLEVGEGQAEAAGAFLREAGLEVARPLRDAGGVERVVHGRKS